MGREGRLPGGNFKHTFPLKVNVPYRVGVLVGARYAGELVFPESMSSQDRYEEDFLFVTTVRAPEYMDDSKQAVKRGVTPIGTGQPVEWHPDRQSRQELSSLIEDCVVKALE